MNFMVGQKVVCVDTSGWGRMSPWNYPVEGHVYTVRELFCDPSGDPVMRVQELRNRVGRCRTNGDVAEPYFRQNRFRPVVEKTTETGMAILREILDRETHQDKPPVKRTVHS